MKKDKSNIFIYGILILIVLVAVFAILDLEDDEDVEPLNEDFLIYGDYRIYERNIGGVDMYALEAFDSNNHQYLFHFRYLPTELEDVPIEEGVVDKILYTNENKDTYKSKIYLSFNPNLPTQIMILPIVAQILWIGDEGHEGIYKIPLQTSFSMDYEGEDHPIKDCSNANNYIGVILEDYGDISVSLDGDCVIIKGNDLEELRRANEKLGYMLLGAI